MDELVQMKRFRFTLKDGVRVDVIVKIIVTGTNHHDSVCRHKQRRMGFYPLVCVCEWTLLCLVAESGPDLSNKTLKSCIVSSECVFLCVHVVVGVCLRWFNLHQLMLSELH